MIDGEGKTSFILYPKNSNSDILKCIISDFNSSASFDSSISKCFVRISITLKNLKITKFRTNDSIINNWNSLKVINCNFNHNEIGASTNTGAIITNYDGSDCKITRSIFTKNNFFNFKVKGAVAIKNRKMNSFTITESNFTNFKSTSYSRGVAIYNNGINKILVDKCQFKNTGEGSTIYNQNGTVSVANCNFTKDSGSIYNYKKGAMTISESVFKNSHDNYSSPITNQGNMKITACKFTKNKCNHGNGAIANNGSVNLSNSKFTLNSATANWGGAIQNQGYMVINSSLFKNNKATRGGAIYNARSMVIRDSIFTANLAVSNTTYPKGGAIFNKKSDKGLGATLKLSNTKFKNNIESKNYRTIFNEKGEIIKKNVTISPKEGTKV